MADLNEVWGEGTYTNENLTLEQQIEKYKKQEEDNQNRCPVCNEKEYIKCNCVLQDSCCINNHWWHNKNGNKKLGRGHTE